MEEGKIKEDSPDLYSLLSPERIVTDTYEESYEDYKERRKLVKKVLGKYMKGRSVHVSHNFIAKLAGAKGITYIKGKDATNKDIEHGEESA